MDLQFPTGPNQLYVCLDCKHQEEVTLSLDYGFITIGLDEDAVLHLTKFN